MFEVRTALSKCKVWQPNYINLSSAPSFVFVILPNSYPNGTVDLTYFRDNLSIREFSKAYVQKTQNSILKQRIKKYHFIEI